MSGLALELESIGSNLSVVNQTFSDGLCGLTDGCSQVIPSIDVRFEVDLNIDEKCASVEVVSVEDSSNVMLNLSDRVTGSGTCADGAGGNGGTGGGEGCTSDADCAHSLRCEGGVVCASGVIGTIPLAITGEVRSIGSGFVRMTVSRDGFSDGLLGATFDEETAVALAEANGGDPDVGAVVRQALDHSEEFVGTSVTCNALSATLEIGGVAVQTE
jgi:hypothetical protein